MVMLTIINISTQCVSQYITAQISGWGLDGKTYIRIFLHPYIWLLVTFLRGNLHK